MYEASHPQGWSAVSSMTGNGMARALFCVKYHSSAGTS